MKKTSLLMATVMATVMATPAAASAAANASIATTAMAGPEDEPTGQAEETEEYDMSDGTYDGGAWNEDPAEEEEVGYEDFGLTDEEVAEFIATDTVQGAVGGIAAIEGAHATISVPGDMRFLDKWDAQKLLELYWGNAADATVLGALVPADAVIMNDIELAFILYYTGEGYVSDDDANDVDYDELLSDLQEYTRTTSDSLAAWGYPRQELVGWAKAPTYDSENKVLRWARHFKFYFPDGEANEALNYDCRILCRRGYVMLQALSDMTVADSVIAKGDELSALVKFDKGYRYEDFDPDKDTVSDWTIGGLIAGTALLSKAGVFAKIGILLAKGWKLILVAIVAIGGIIAKIRGKKKDEKEEDSDKDTDKAEGDDSSKTEGSDKPKEIEK